MKPKKGGAVGLAVIVAGLSAVTAFMLLVGKLFRRKRVDAALDEFDMDETQDTKPDGQTEAE